MNHLAVTYRGTVYPWHCDHMGHMNVMWYTGKFDEASWYLLAQIGLTRSYLQERNRGLAAVQQNITDKRELRAGDIVSVRSGVLDVQEKVIRIFHEMRNEETHEVAAFATIVGIYMDSLARKSRPFPPDIVERGRAMKLNQSKLYWAETQRAIPKPSALC